jgi:hypothetical protein
MDSSDSYLQTTVSRRSITACVAGLLLLAAMISWINFKVHFNGFGLNDYHEYCEIARNFYEGNGYSTSVLRPIAYKYFTTLPQPEVTRLPLYPFFLALFFHLFGPNDNAVVIFNSICYGVLLVMVFMVAFELSRNMFVGLVAALMTALMESFLNYTLAAEPNIFYAAMFMGFFYFYLKYPQKTLLQGIFLGLLYMLRANTLFVFIGFLFALFVNSDNWKLRLRTTALLILGYTIGLLPYMARNFVILGKPLFSLYQYSLLLFTKQFPQYTVWTQITSVDPKAYALSHPAEMISKSLIWLKILLFDSISFYKPVLLLMIGASLFIRPADRRLKIVRTAALAGIIVQLIMLMPIGSVPYYYMFFFPLIISTELANIRIHLERFTHIVLLVALAVVMWTTLPYWKTPKPANPFISIGRQVADTTKKTDIIVTDIPWEVTWYANRRTIWLPYDLKTLQVISTTLKPNYVLLVGLSYAAYGDNAWQRMLREPAFASKAGYEFYKIIFIDNHPVAIMFKAKA